MPMPGIPASRRLMVAGVAGMLLLYAATDLPVAGRSVAWCAGDSSAVRDTSRTIHAMEVARDRPTEAAKGRRLGLIIGGIGTGTFAALLGLLVNALCEADCPEIEGAEWVAFVGGGVLVGAAGGALLGTIVGSMVAADAPPLPTGARWRPIGSITLQAVGGDLLRRSDGHAGAGGRLTLLAHRGAAFRVGVEGGYLGTLPKLTSVALTTRLVHRTGAYALLSVGDNAWHNEVNLLGAATGVGYEPSGGTSRSSWGAEVRYHFSLQRYNEPENYRAVTLALGRRWGW